MAELSDLIVKTARSFAGTIYLAPNGTVVGADTLVQIYKTSGPGGGSVLLNGQWSTLHERGVRTGMWIRKIPLQLTPNQETVAKYCTNDVDGSLAWCGIFATFVIKKAGFTAFWNQGVINCSNYTRWGKGIRSTPSDYKTRIEPGDICCLDTVAGAANNHHVVVVNVNQSTGSLDTVEGNLSSPRQSVNALLGVRNVRDIYTLYKLVPVYNPTEL